MNRSIFAVARMPVARACLFLAALLATAPAGMAQALDCGRLQAQIAALGQGGGGRSAQYEQAAQKQRAEIDRTGAYARSIGCENRQFLFFGSAPPAQCGPINAQLARMRENYNQLSGLARQASGEAQRRDLTARFDAYCRGTTPQRGIFDAIFGGGGRTMPLDAPLEPLPNEPRPPADDSQTLARGGSQAICVRSCDGGFFPISYAARSRALSDLDDLCKALCPGTEATLYTHAPSRDFDTAVSVDGDAYKDLPNAFKFQKSFDPSCSCKPASQSWVQALAEAEKVLGRESKSDIFVTAEKSAEMARPKAASEKSGGKQDAKTRMKVDEDPAAAERVIGEQAPTASRDSAGIAATDSAGREVIGAAKGEIKTQTRPDGTTRRIRIIGPSP